MPSQTAADIMTRSLVTLSPEDGIYQAIKVLLRRKISGAPVVDASGRLVGILSEKDCLRVLVGAALDGLPDGRVRNFMTESVEAIRPDASLYDITHRFITGSYRRLPVVDDGGRVVGQVSRRDALSAIEAIRDDPRLYGTAEQRPTDSTGVDSAMRRFRGR